MILIPSGLALGGRYSCLSERTVLTTSCMRPTRASRPSSRAAGLCKDGKKRKEIEYLQHLPPPSPHTHTNSKTILTCSGYSATVTDNVLSPGRRGSLCHSSSERKGIIGLINLRAVSRHVYLGGGIRETTYRTGVNIYVCVCVWKDTVWLWLLPWVPLHCHTQQA